MPRSCTVAAHSLRCGVTRGPAQEVGAYAWHRLADLPATPEEASQVYMSTDGKRHRFFAVQPFVRELRRWVRCMRAVKQRTYHHTCSARLVDGQQARQGEVCATCGNACVPPQLLLPWQA